MLFSRLICAVMVALMLTVASPSVAEISNETGPDMTLPDTTLSDMEETAFFWPWQKEFLLILSVNTRNHTLEFKTLEQDRKLLLRPNNGALLKPQFIQGSLSFAIESSGFFETEVKPEMGESEFLHFELSHKWSSMKMDYYYETYRGFYVEDQQKADGTYSVFPDIETRRCGIAATYYWSDYPFRSKLYYAGPWTSREPAPRQSGATSLFTLLLDNYNIRNLPSDPVVLSQILNGDLINFRSAEFYTLSIKGGGILYKYGPSGFAEIGLTLGTGLFREKFSDGSATDTTTKSASTASLYMDTGLRRGRWLLGLMLRSDMVNPSFRTTRFSLNSNLISLYFGRRFY